MPACPPLFQSFTHLTLSLPCNLLVSGLRISSLGFGDFATDVFSQDSLDCFPVLFMKNKIPKTLSNFTCHTIYRYMHEGTRYRKASDVIPAPTSWPEDRGGQWFKSQSELKDLRNRNTNVGRQEEMEISARAESRFTVSLPFCSVWALNSLDNAHPD